MSKISAEQLDMVRTWAGQGIDLNGIQKRLVSECGLHLTFMDVRFLLLDNGIEIVTAPEPAPAAPAEEAPAPAETPVPAADGKPVVTLDELYLPGALVSGKVVFPSGTRCAWQIDQMGRFGWIEQTAVPTPEELQAFQLELTGLLRQMA
ncbi:MAG: hypothetical protein MJ051_05130 [Akkermansia sp.]|nr:hypothetical protein [Akkermansia sp.]